MTYYNIEKLEALKEEYLDSMRDDETLFTNFEIVIKFFIGFIEEKEKASSFDPNQLEIPFPDEDNSK